MERIFAFIYNSFLISININNINADCLPCQNSDQCKKGEC